MGNRVRKGAIHHRFRDTRDYQARQFVAHLSYSWFFRFALAAHQRESGRESGSKRHILRSGAQSPLLPSAQKYFREFHPIRKNERTDTARPVQFAAIQGNDIRIYRVQVRRDVERRLPGVHMQEHVGIIFFRRGADNARNLAQRLHRSYFMIGPTNRDQTCLRTQRTFDYFCMDDAVLVRLQVRYLPPQSLYFSEAIEDRGMLYGAYYPMSLRKDFACKQEFSREPSYRKIIPFRSAGSKNYLARFHTAFGGNLLARFL